MSSIPPSSDETAVAAVDHDAPHIPGYRALWRIGAGSTGDVWAVERVPSGPIRAPLALKRLHPALAADRALASRFVDEMRLASRITHPCVCRIADGGTSDGVPYIVMELLIGLTLAEVQAHVRASLSDAVHARWPWVLAAVLAQACEGLHAAHELTDDDGAPLAVVHRDVSPDNLVVCFDGTVRVIDFGIAAARRARERTATGELHAKLAYASPEQVEGLTVDRRTDVWALGVVLWEGLTGAPLFERATLLETVEAIGRAVVPSAGELAKNAPIALEEIAAKALARDPERRYATARAMGRDLRLALHDEGPFDVAEVAAFLGELMPGVEPRLRRLGTRSRGEARPEPPPPRRMPRRALELGLALLCGAGLGWLLAYLA
jgi:serine/threonine-protein kinase